MSKRYGRNQKRRHREQIAKQLADIKFLRKALDEVSEMREEASKRLINLELATKHDRDAAARVERWLFELGIVSHPLFKASALRIASDRQPRSIRMQKSRAPGEVCDYETVECFSLGAGVRLDGSSARSELHFTVTYADDCRAAYMVSRDALRSEPCTEAVVHHICQQLIGKLRELRLP